MEERTGRFRRPDRLRKSRDYRRVSRDGRRRASRAFVVLVTRDPSNRSPGAFSRDSSRRLGIKARRKIGHAVARNRIKRCVREWFRVSRGRLEDDIDVVVIARRPAADLSGREIAADLDALMA